MKKVLITLLIICLFLSGCKKDEEEPNNTVPDISEEEKIVNNLSSSDLGTVVGDFSNRFTLIKVTNKNDKDLYLDVKLTYYNNESVTDEDDVYVYVGAGKFVYAVRRRYAEAPVFTRYTYKVDLIETIDGYSDIINNITVSNQRSSKDITVTIGNNGSRTTTARALIFYYKDNKIVSVDESVQYNLMPTSILPVGYPLKDGYHNTRKDINEIVEYR